MTSLWLDGVEPGAYPAAAPGARCDVVVVGGGLTGLTTAVLLARGGSSVVLLEARGLGAGTTGRSTAKVSLLQGTRLARLARRHPDEVVRAYVEGSREGMDWLLRYCVEHDVPAQRRTAVTYATTAKGRARIEAELEVGRRVGLPLAWHRQVDLPVPVVGAVGLAHQAQLDPVDVLRTLADDLVRRGGLITVGARLRGVRRGDGGTRCTVVADLDGEHVEFHSDAVVLATGTPVLDRGVFFARLEARRSYALALEAPGPLPQGMYLSADDVVRSVRTTPGPPAADGAPGPELLLVGGSGHTVGRSIPTSRHEQALRRWSDEWFPGSRVTHAWSAQDYAPADGLPLVGHLVPGDDRVLVATGYDKWGMATAVAASLVLSAALLGHHRPGWSTAWAPWGRTELAGLREIAAYQGRVARRLVRDWARPLPAPGDRSAPPEGQARVERDGVRPTGVATVDGHRHRTSAVCTHLGGVLSWNDAERTWDCPLHGSRFGLDGRVLEGPATCPLRSVD